MRSWLIAQVEVFVSKTTREEDQNKFLSDIFLTGVINHLYSTAEHLE